MLCFVKAALKALKVLYSVLPARYPILVQIVVPCAFFGWLAVGSYHENSEGSSSGDKFVPELWYSSF